MPSWLRPLSLIVAALSVAGLAGWLAARLHLPLPWMLGPLFSVALLRVAGVPLLAPRGGRQAGQWAIGTALGLYFTPAVLAELGRHTGAIVLMAASAVALGLVAARIIGRWGRVEATTAFFAGLPGGASEMVVLAEAHGGATDRIAAAHALRVMMVVSSIPFVIHAGPFEGHETFRALSSQVDWLRFPLLLAASPGGMAEMSITAREMHLSVPLVTATHVLRVVLLTACAPLLFRAWLAWRRQPPSA